MVRTLPSRLAARPAVVVATLAMLVATSATVPVPTAAAATATSPPAPGAPSYVAPVAGATIVDHFRAPSSPYAAGNRGLDEVTPTGAAVVASAAGQVIFAGEVAGSLHVTLLHADGLRTSYSYLAAVMVRVGDQIDQGAPIGVAGPIFHFGVRDAGGAYLDPELLLGTRRGAHLVAGPDEGGPPLHDASAVDRLRHLARLQRLEPPELAAVVAAGRGATSPLVSRALAMSHEALAVSLPGSLASLATEIDRWHDQQRHCTPAADHVPAPTGRRIAILVGGLGSTSDQAAVDHVDVGTLGYAPADVLRFSYRGGRVPPPGEHGELAAIAGSPYGPSDTEVDLHRSADRLLALVDAVALADPGVPIDLIAHSMGGLVARLALARAATPTDRIGPDRWRSLGVVVTIGTPHQGADLATAVAAIGPRSPGGQALEWVGRAAGLDLDLTGPAIGELSQTSSVISELARPVRGGVRLVSIGASGDLTVPDVRTVVAGAEHVTVHLSGPHAHDRLPSDPATTREIGLAIAGAPQTCADLQQGLGDVLVSHGIAQAEDALGLALATRRS